MDDDLRDLLRTFTESFLSGGYDVLWARSGQSSCTASGSLG